MQVLTFFFLSPFNIIIKLPDNVFSHNIIYRNITEIYFKSHKLSNEPFYKYLNRKFYLHKYFLIIN